MESSRSGRDRSCCLGVVLYFIGAFIVIQLSFPVVNTFIERGWLLKRQVTDIEHSSDYPVVVLMGKRGISTGKPTVIFWRDIRSHPSELKERSFILPANNRKAHSVPMPFDIDYPTHGIEKAVARYEMTPLPNGNQAFHVVVTREGGEKGKHTFVSWYEATPDSIKPQYAVWWRDWNTFWVFDPLVIVGYTVLWFMVPWGYGVVRRNRNRWS